MTDALKPAARPCGSCPYVKTTPSGLWAAEEYEKLPRYDGDTGEQIMKGATAVFMCHQRDGCLCGGWLLTHDRNHLLALRFSRNVDPSVWDYNPAGVEVFASGQEACDHGMRDIDEPGPEALRLMRGIGKLPGIKKRDE